MVHDLGLLAREQGDYGRARELFEESLSLWRSLDDLAWIANVALGLGITYLLDGKPTQARVRLDEAAGLYERLGDRYGRAVVAAERGHLARAEGQTNLAITLFGEALRYFAAIGASEAVVYCIECLAATAADRDDAGLALRLFGASQEARKTMHLPPPGDRDARLVDAGIAQASKGTGPDAASMLVVGRALSLDQARQESLELVARAAACDPASGDRSGDRN